MGRVKKLRARISTAPPRTWTTPGYDALSRTVTVTGPDGAISSTTFDGLTTTLTAPTSSDGKTRKRTEVKNSQGQMVLVTDALAARSTITTTPSAISAKSPQLAVATARPQTSPATFDLRGRKIAMNDPDMGAWSYSYNAFGELVRQQDAKAQVTTMTYDLLGRLLTRSEAEGISRWAYDDSPPR